MLEFIKETKGGGGLGEEIIIANLKILVKAPILYKIKKTGCYSKIKLLNCKKYARFSSQVCSALLALSMTS